MCPEVANHFRDDKYYNEIEMREEESTAFELMIWYFAVITFIWIIFFVHIARTGRLILNCLPMWLIYVSWPAVLIFSLEVIRSPFFKHWKNKLLISLIIIVFLITPSIYGTYSLAQYRSKSKQFLNIVIEALNLVRNSASFSEGEGILGNVQKDSLLTIICDSFSFPTSSTIPDNEYIRKRFGRDIFISPKFGKIPRSINSVRTVVVVERNQKATASYTYSSDYQWLYRVTTIDWEKHRPVQTKTFEGGVLAAVTMRPAGGSRYGTEPWELVTLWLFKDK